MTANIHPQTGIAYGYISANAMNPETVFYLIERGTSLTYQSFLDDLRSEIINELASVLKLDASDIRENEHLMEQVNSTVEYRSDEYQPEEEIHEGVTDGVKWQTSWLGGAMNFWIFESPYLINGSRASPCVPNACIAGHPGPVAGYGVPPDWLSDETLIEFVPYSHTTEREYLERKYNKQFLKCIFCLQDGIETPAVRLMPQGSLASYELCPCCANHTIGWWDGADWDGRHLEKELYAKP